MGKSKGLVMLTILLIRLLDLYVLQVAQQQCRRPRIQNLHDDPRLCPRARRSPMVRLVRGCAFALDHAQYRHGHLLLRAHRRVSVHPGVRAGLLSRVRRLRDWGPHHSSRHHRLRLPPVRTGALSASWLWRGEHSAGGRRCRDWGLGSRGTEIGGAEVEG